MYRNTKCDCFMSSPQISETRDLQDPRIVYNNRRGPTLEVGGGNGKSAQMLTFPQILCNQMHRWTVIFPLFEEITLGNLGTFTLPRLERPREVWDGPWFDTIGPWNLRDSMFLLYCIVWLVLCFTEVANHFGIVWCRVHSVAAQPWPNLDKHGHN